MTPVDAMFWVVCLVLVVAGASKVSAPQVVAPTLAALLPGRSGAATSGVWAARTLGGAEVLVGLLALTVGGAASAGAVAVMYSVFAVVVVLARRRGLASCGCFGLRSAPPSWVHVAVDVVSGAVAVGAALSVDGPVPVADGLDELGGLLAVVVAVLVVAATALVVFVDTSVADAVESAHGSTIGADRESSGEDPDGARSHRRTATR